MTTPARKSFVIRAGLLSLLFLAAALWPYAVYADLHLQDFPNHLAAAFILLHPNDPLLQLHYRIDWSIVPDLGWELWVMALSPLFSPTIIAKIMIVAVLLLGVGGCFALGRALTGRWTLVPLIAFPVLLNGALANGYLSFDFGLALALWAMAFWAWMPERRWAIRLAVATLAATALYIVHLCSFGIYGIFVLGFELWRFRDDPAPLRRLGALARDGVQALPALIIAVHYAGAGHLAEGAAYAHPWTRFGEVSLLIESGWPWIDIVVILAYTGFLILSAVKGWLSLSSKVTFALLIYAALLFILPDGLIFGSQLPWRLVLALVLIGITSMTPTPQTPRPLIPALLSVALCITLAVSLAQNRRWSKSAAEKDAFLSVIAPMPDGSRLFLAHSGFTPSVLTRDEGGAYHEGAYAVLAKRALVPSLFTAPGQHLLRFRDPVIQDVAQRDSLVFLTDIEESFSERHASFGDYLMHFDYAVLHGEDDVLEKRMLPFNQLSLINRVGDYRLYRIGRAP